MAEFIGFHGTSSSSAARIMQNNFRINHRNIGWLGSGVYFFEENRELAQYWADEFNTEGAVVRCELQVPDAQIFDVTNPGSHQTKLFHETRNVLIEQELARRHIDIVVRNSKDLDGKVFNIISLRKGYKLVRMNTYTYQEKDREHHIRGSKVANGIELCLRDIRYIQQKSII